MLSLKNKQFYIVGVSDFVKRFYDKCGLPYRTIYNAVNDSIFVNNNLDYDRKKGNFVFFASFERGGELCIRIFSKINSIYDKKCKLHITSYEKDDFEKINDSNDPSSIVKYSSLSKVHIKKLLDECDYFIYPLVNKTTGSVHHDTFACVILEALACGVTVITWDVACFKSIYSNHIDLIDPPIKSTYNPQAQFGVCDLMNTQNFHFQ